MVNLPLIYEKDTELHTVQLKNYEQTVKNLPRNKAFFEAFLHSKDMLDEETVSFYV